MRFTAGRRRHMLRVTRNVGVAQAIAIVEPRYASSKRRCWRAHTNGTPPLPRRWLLRHALNVTPLKTPRYAIRRRKKNTALLTCPFA